jgi:hypothetical protein
MAKVQDGTSVGKCAKLSILFYRMHAKGLWPSVCLRVNMNMSLIIFAAQIVVTLLAFLGGLEEDPRFADDKLMYRS